MGFTGSLGTPDSQLGKIELGGPPSGGGGGGGLTPSVTQVMGLSDLATVTRFAARSVTDTMTLSGVATGTADDLESPSHAMSLSQTVVVEHDIHRALSDTLTFTDDTRTNLHSVSIEDNLGLTQTALGTGPIYLNIRHNLGLSDTNLGHPGVSNQGYIDFLALKDQVGREIFMSVSHSISFTEQGFRNTAVKDHLAFVQGVVLSFGDTDCVDTLAFVDTVGLSGTFGFIIPHNLGLNDSVTYFVSGGPCTLKNYTPFVGNATNPLYPPPPTQLAGPLADQPRFLLVYPPQGTVTDALNFRRGPSFGNKDQLAFNRVNRVTRGGTPDVYADPMWPKTQTLVLQFNALRKNESDALRVFMKTHLGQKIGIVDWEGRYWTGVILTPGNPFVQDDRNSFSASFSFQGAYDTWTNQSIPSVLPCDNGNAASSRPGSGCGCTDSGGGGGGGDGTGGTFTTYSAETDDNTIIGSPVYFKVTQHVGLAVANNNLKSQIAGLCTSAKNSGFAAEWIAEGTITMSDWTAITGTSVLTPGALYFLDPSTPGALTKIAPTAPGQFVVKVGRAESTIDFDVEIEAPIAL